MRPSLSLRLLLTLSLCTLLLCAEDARASTFLQLSAQWKEPVPVRLISGTMPVVKIKINRDQTLNMLVDTGAPTTVLPPELFAKDKRGKAIRISTLCFENDACVRGLILKPKSTAFSHMGEGYFNGILGLDVLSMFDITIDYREGKLYLHDVTEGGIEIPFEFRKSKPGVDVVVNGNRVQSVLLDTGSSAVRMTSEAVSRLDKKIRIVFESVVFGLLQQERVRHIEAETYCVGDACVDDIIIQLALWPATGGEFFRRFETTFRFRERILELKPLDSLDHVRPDMVRLWGFKVSPKDASDVVFVGHDTPAERAGLREGERITHMNGQAVEEIGYFGLTEIAEAPQMQSLTLSVTAKDASEREVLLSIEP